MDFIPVNQPALRGKEREYLLECLATGWISSEGPFVKRFEAEFAQRVNRQNAISVCNGSAALDVAVAALGIGPGDEVILPTFTIISCASAIIRAGATPVLVDANSTTWNMDVSQLERCVTPRTKAIMVVHIYGLPVDIEPLIAIAKHHNLVIIEDAAEMHGQTYRGQPCGSFGEISTFSFYANKHITTGEGGMVVTNDVDLADKCRSLRNLCFQPQQRFVHEELGWNFRMGNLQAALGLAQLEQLDRFVQRKREIGKRYTEGLANLNRVQLPLYSTDYADNVYWVYGLVLDKTLSFDAKEAMDYLRTKGIGTRPFFWPMHEQPVFKKMGLFQDEHYPVSEYIARHGFYIPSGLALTNEQIDYVITNVKEMAA